MSDKKARTAIWIVGVLLLAAPGRGTAQTNIETNAPGIQLNFSVPGARSLALGGTFLGRADDATAAYANPAGLANLPQAEASLELRGWEYTHVFTDRGRSGVPSGIDADTIGVLVDGSATDQVSGVSFASYVYPRRRWAAAVYYHSLADFEANFSTRGAFVGDDSPTTVLRLFPVTSLSSLEISNSGVSVSYRLSEQFSIGFGLSRYDFDIDSTLERFSFELNEFGEIGLDETFLHSTQTQQGSDSDLGATVGILWRLHAKWQLGAVFRQGPSFSFETRHQLERRRPPPPVVNQARFHVPDVWGVGVMWQATDRAIFGMDFYRIGYSALSEEFTDVFVPDVGRADDYAAEDGNELHLGVEYLFPNGARPWFLRSGIWWDPEHGVRYVGEPSDNFARLEATRFRSRDGVVHWAAGGGVVSSSYQVDAGVDYSQRTLTISVSTVVRF